MGGRESRKMATRRERGQIKEGIREKGKEGTWKGRMRKT